MSNQVNSSVILTVTGLQGVPKPTATTNYGIAASSNNKVLYGTNHIGTEQGWNDSFAINLKDVEYDDLILAVFVDDHEYGRANLSLLDFSKGFSNSQQQPASFELTNNGHSVGRINTKIHKLLKEEIVGGLVPPSISLRSDAVPKPVKQLRGIEKIHAQNLNFFSCLDANDMGWQPYPIKFKSRIRQQYDVTKSIAELQKLSQQAAESQI